MTRSVEPAPSADYLDGVAARQLARRIEEYWHNHGHPEVSCWVELVGGVWCQRSSLDRSGLPPPAAAVAAKRTPRSYDGLDDEELPAGGNFEAPIAAIPDRGKCLWPIGEPGDRDFHWCGCRVSRPASPYCPKHVAGARHRTG